MNPRGAKDNELLDILFSLAMFGPSRASTAKVKAWQLRMRLHGVIRQDRAERNDGRWVREGFPQRAHRRLLGWRFENSAACFIEPMKTWLLDEATRLRKPHYRWSYRR